MDFIEFSAVGERAVRSCGQIVRSVRQNRDFRVQFKEDGSPSTRADRDGEQKIGEVLLDAFPSHGFSGEECGVIRRGKRYRWHTDSVDGTWALLNNESTLTVNLVLYDHNDPILCMIYNPIVEELYVTGKNRRSTRNGASLPFVECEHLPAAVVNFQISASRKEDVGRLYGLLEREHIGKLVSLGGSAAYSLAKVAEGSYGAYVGGPWTPIRSDDLTPAVELIKNAGGVVSGVYGGIENDRYLLAANTPSLHEELREFLVDEKFGT